MDRPGGLSYNARALFAHEIGILVGLAVALDGDSGNGFAGRFFGHTDEAHAEYRGSI
jgi:hypothetical protein